MKKHKFNIDKFLNIWMYTWFFIPFIVSVIILIYRVITTKGDEHMSGELWGFCGAIVTAIITLIGVIIGVSVKRPKVKNTDEIKSDTLDIKNQIGENKNTSLIRDHQEIINKIEKNLENNDSIIISQLKNINDFTEKSKFNREVLDKEMDYLKVIEEQRVKDKLMLKELKANYIELNKDNISLKKELEDKNKEIKILKLEIRNLNDKNQEPSF